MIAELEKFNDVVAGLTAIDDCSDIDVAFAEPLAACAGATIR